MKRTKRKETLLPNLLQVRKTANEFSPLSNPLFLSGDIFSSPFSVQSQRAPISQNSRGAVAPLPLPFSHSHYITQCFNPNDTMV
jgi:hypothetical protein